MARPQIQVILATEAIPERLRVALAQTDATTACCPMSVALHAGALPAADAVVIVVPAGWMEAETDGRVRPDASSNGKATDGLTGALRSLFERLAEHPRATLVLAADGQPVPRVQHPPTLPVAFNGGQNEHDLAVRLALMLELRPSLDSLHQGLLANRRSGESVVKRYMNQLRLASQVQQDFLPDTLPRYGRVSFELLFRPVDYVSGDLYDVHRLDEEHVGVALADATGHGIPAALLTVYIKRALRGKEIENGSYRILPPDEVLRRLNDDLLDAQLSECPFMAAVYAVLNTRTLEVRLARAGAPYPIYRTARGELRPIRSRGGVVGVLPEARFEVRTVCLQAGDSLLIYSDGLERIVNPRLAAVEIPRGLWRAARRVERWKTAVTAAAMAAHGAADARPVAVAAAGAPGDQRVVDGAVGASAATCVADSGSGEPPLQTPIQERDAYRNAEKALPVERRLVRPTWYGILRDDGPTAALEQAAGRQRALRRMGYPLDDVTVLCLNVDR